MVEENPVSHNQKSKAPPALAVFDGLLHMVHLGDSSNDIWHSTFDGAPVGQADVHIKSQISRAPRRRQRMAGACSSSILATGQISCGTRFSMARGGRTCKSSRTVQFSRSRPQRISGVSWSWCTSEATRRICGTAPIRGDRTSCMDVRSRRGSRARALSATLMKCPLCRRNADTSGAAPPGKPMT